MKKNVLFTALACLTFFICNTVSAQDFENAGTYMGYIGKQHETIAKRFLAYNSAISHGKREKKVEALKAKLLDEIQESKMNLSGMPSYKKDKSYRDSAVSFMKLYYNALNEDYSKIVNMEEIAEQSYDAMEAYLLAKDMVDKKMDDASKALQNEGKKFAAANNITLIESQNDIDAMMKKVGETTDYYNPIYLIFFKSYKQEAYLLDAIAKKNINGIEQNRNALLQYAQDGLAKLAGMKGFEGDNSLVINCKKLLGFYAKESTEKIPVISDYLLKQEAFEKMQKEFEKKTDRTKEEVETFNKGVKDVNNGVKVYNNTNNSLNQTRNELLNNWNTTVNEFFDTHMPTYN